jgi:glucoamylase
MPNDRSVYAPGWPGIPARWTSSAKTGVGVALPRESRVWFTLSHGILNEVYFPRIDQACTRDMGFIVTDGRTFFSEEKRHARHEIAHLVDGVPVFRLANTCLAGRYRIDKEVLADPRRDVVLQRVRLSTLRGEPANYRLFVLLAPHLGNRGAGNTAWIGDWKGTPMLFAERDGNALALASSAPWLARSAGFVGTSDGWQDLVRNKTLTWKYERAENGNVALVGEIDHADAVDSFVLALGFGRTSAEAAHSALASLQDGFEQAMTDYVSDWRTWQDALVPLGSEGSTGLDLYRASMAVIRTHEATRFSGGIIASLSIPWGSSKGDDDLGGYHVAWPRDLVQAAGALLAAGAYSDGRRVLGYLAVTQEADGHWPQNMWLEGTPHWGGVQMDETALPILLLDLARRVGAIDAGDVARFWPMARRAASFLVRNGPVTQQDRWEEDPGYSPFTLAAEVAALLAAADLADANGAADAATYLRETADAWNDAIERWTYAIGTDLARDTGVDGYYVRITPPEAARPGSPAASLVSIKNRPPDQSTQPAVLTVSPDALALVRFGLRAPDDPRIVATVKVVDSLLKVDLPSGPAWRRYNGDGYGEHEDGRPFDGTGVGRRWPLLTGERAHYELAAGRREAAEALTRTLESFANGSGLLPEQVWDAGRPPRARAFQRAAGRLGHAARLGARRVREATSLAPRRARLRSAAPARAAIPGGQNPVAAPCLAIQSEMPRDGCRENATYRGARAGCRSLDCG